MFKILFTLLIFISYNFNFSLYSQEINNKIKIGLLVPFTGEYADVGKSILYSLQLALKEIDEKKVVIYPKDSGLDNKDKLLKSIEELIKEDIKVVIGPLTQKHINEVYKFKNISFVSLSNINPGIKNNVVSIGVGLESQLLAIKKFLEKKNKNKTVILYPDNSYSDFIEGKLKKIKIKPYKTLKYNPDPRIITGEIEKLTNYSQRKRNLENRKKILEKKDDLASQRELKILEQKYTLGKVNFDSVIVLDFGSNLKSVLASLVFADVNQEDVIFTTINQWFDKSIFFENSIKTIYYPSVDLKNFEKFNQEYFNMYDQYPSEIGILAYDALGLIYYVWNKKNGIENIKDFLFKDKIKSKIGSFKFIEDEIIQDLNIYKIEGKKFKKL
ncbi:MAG: hypothetical protein CL687_01485 [Candidatus Pelagibacter sp.]|nr:hypothetical protein [Candidatus Pelagibacter sp.]OUW24411.1 MAG: hypothetical protein CBD34_00760 [Rickettsiales bacterium TMED174]|tara:strand:+ start:255 stop:1409 length:1155 start_codon:yes stop_codon:yes gene_type:complete